jgi:hypothetical protein
MHRSAKIVRTARILCALGLGVSAAAFGFSGAYAETVTPPQVSQAQHFLDCFGVMITDPAVHAAECSPSQVPPSTDQLAPTSSGPNCVPVLDDSDSTNTCGLPPNPN